MLLAENRKALHDYDMLDIFEAGLMLLGHEVKSVKKSQISLKGAYVDFHKNEPYLVNAHISKYKPAGRLPDYDPERRRKLLLHYRQLAYLRAKSTEKGLTIIPLRVYTKGRLVKVEIAVARGRKQYDKKELLKNRDIKREIERVKKMVH